MSRSLFFARVVATFLTDASLALVTGLLLASWWLARAEPLPNFAERDRLPMRLAACVLTFALGLQLLLLTMDFSGQSALPMILRELPDVVSTHPGEVAVLSCGAAFLLLLCTFLRPHLLRERSVLFSLCCLLVLRSASGHAATEGYFTWAEFLQLLHLTAMAVWSGGVIISGLYAVPRIQSAQAVPAARRYLHQLSRTATVAVLVVALSGVFKTYHAAEGSVSELLRSPWGYVLLAKVALVLLALSLGALNRRWIHAADTWEHTGLRRSAIALRMEAWTMTAVLALSAALGNMSPPGANS